MHQVGMYLHGDVHPVQSPTLICCCANPESTRDKKRPRTRCGEDKQYFVLAQLVVKHAATCSMKLHWYMMMYCSVLATLLCPLAFCCTQAAGSICHLCAVVHVCASSHTPQATCHPPAQVHTLSTACSSACAPPHSAAAPACATSCVACASFHAPVCALCSTFCAACCIPDATACSPC